MKKITVTEAHVNDSKKLIIFSNLIVIKTEHHLQILNHQWDHCTVKVCGIKLQAYFLNSMINIKLYQF